MTDKPLSAMERAERLHFSLYNEPKMDYTDEIRLIAAEIESAVEEDRKGLELPEFLVHKAKTEAYEDAAKIADSISIELVRPDERYAAARCGEAIRAKAKEFK